MPLTTIHGDLTAQHTDAVVNAANNALLRGGGVCGAIFSAAGERDLAEACSAIGRCDTGKAVVTGGFRLSATYILHTVGPVWKGGGAKEEELLRACYRNCLILARSLKIVSIAFPLISSGIFGYPKERAYSVAVSEITEYLAAHEKETMEVFLVLYP